MSDERTARLDRRGLLRVLIAAPPLTYAACVQSSEPGRISDDDPGSSAYMDEARAQGRKRGGEAVAGPVERDVPEPQVNSAGYLDCAEGAELDPASRQTRKALNYKAKAGSGEKRCYYCTQWQPAADEQSLCGGCKLFTGPVNANGWCEGFAPRPA